jgi:cation transport ATPase
MIVSAIDGRMRIVAPGLKNQKKADAIEEKLQQATGVMSAKVNRLTGSLLILYDKSRIESRTLRQAVKGQLKVLKASGAKPLTGKGARKNVKRVMLITITSAMAMALADYEKWHYRIGAVFLSSLSLHLYQNRRTLLK